VVSTFGFGRSKIKEKENKREGDQTRVHARAFGAHKHRLGSRFDA
jgi:hypothetical protein